MILSRLRGSRRALPQSGLLPNSLSWRPLFAICLALGIVLAAPLRAQKSAPIVLHLDSAATQIRWTLDTNVHTVHGSFMLKSGEVKVDPGTGNAEGAIVIDATSGESADAARDRRMHSAVLESAKFPTITFRATHVDGRIDLSTDGTVVVSGILNLHGQDHPLQLTINLRPRPSAVALTTRFTIPFVAWGLKDPSTFIFRTGKDVMLEIDAVARQASP